MLQKNSLGRLPLQLQCLQFEVQRACPSATLYLLAHFGHAGTALMDFSFENSDAYSNNKESERGSRISLAGQCHWPPTRLLLVLGPHGSTPTFTGFLFFLVRGNFTVIVTLTSYETTHVCALLNKLARSLPKAQRGWAHSVQVTINRVLEEKQGCTKCNSKLKTNESQQICTTSNDTLEINYGGVLAAATGTVFRVDP